MALNRRDFLRKTALIGIGGFVASSPFRGFLRAENPPDLTVVQAPDPDQAVAKAIDQVQKGEIKFVETFDGLCPSCGLSLIELHLDMTFSCTLCDAHGRFERKFGENVLIWDQYSVEHSRRTTYGRELHRKHIGYSQYDDHIVQTNPKVNEELLAPYVAYGKRIKPGK